MTRRVTGFSLGLTLFCSFLVPAVACGGDPHALTSTQPRSLFASLLAPGGILQGPSVHATLAPLAVTYDAVGAVHMVPTLYVADLFDGTTTLYDATTLTALSTIANPAAMTTTTGLTTDGMLLYWIADGVLYQSAMSGASPTMLGSIALPSGGQAGDCCLDGTGDLWVVDVTYDRYSKHSVVDGSYLGESFYSPSGTSAFGNSIAYRPECGRFELPHGSFASGQVTTLSVVDATGAVYDSFSLAGLGTFVNGVVATATSPSASGPSLLLVENATGALYELELADPCPGPSSDCHAIPGQSSRYSWSNAPTVTETATPGFPVSAVQPTTFSTIVVTAPVDPIRDLECGVDITHTFVGDLRVTLTDPSGGVALTLHDGAGGTSDDIHAAFSDAGRAYGAPMSTGDTMQPAGPGAMADFDGLASGGPWQLAVTDLFPGEDGVLDAWQLSWTTNLSIPDDDLVGVTTTSTIPPSVLDAVGDLDVSLTLEHRDPSQLVVELTSPMATTVRLLDHSAGFPSGVATRFDDDVFGDRTPSGPGTLLDFQGEPVAGDWTLSVIDDVPSDDGEVVDWELLVCPASCLPPEAFLCASDCVTGEVTLSWSVPQGYSALELRRDGVVVANLPGAAIDYVDNPGSGIYLYELVALCSPGAVGVSCELVHSGYSGETDVIFAGEQPYGAVPSAESLAAELLTLGSTVAYTDNLDALCLTGLTLGTNLWLCLGTFPANRVLTAAEGQRLVDLQAAGVDIYIEGGDHWGFDPVTPFVTHDGVEDTTASDGDDSFVSMSGLAHGSLDLSDLTAGYAQDQLSTSDHTDRLLATGTTMGAPVDATGPDAGLIWRDAIQLYGTGVYHIPAATNQGIVIAQSWEFGGFGGDRLDLATRYLSVMDLNDDPVFVRSDANDDGSVNVADAIFMLGTLFMAQPIGCHNSLDSNDDESGNIADPVFLLAFLFSGGPAPAPPFGSCGVDPTPGMLGCNMYGSCP